MVLRHGFSAAMVARLLTLLAVLLPVAAWGQVLSPEALALKVEPPYELGAKLSEKGVWSIRDRTGADAGYIFETGPMAPLPGFSGAPIHVLVTLDAAGRFLSAELLEHNEPIFVSGLGQAPFHAFMRQYRGHSIFDSMTV
ncbi:MAG: 4Fe-4S binding protein, partial [Pseudomonadota bacterium]